MSTPSFIHFGKPSVEKANTTAKANVLAGDPQMGVWLYGNDAQTSSRCGIWECTAGDHRAKMDGYMEFCHILEGEAEITLVSDGSKRTVRAGDSFMMEAGLEMDWHVPTYIRKCFVISDVVEK